MDDAWIVSRVAHHGLVNGSFAFNPGGPVTDAVTPLGFAHVLALTGRVLGLQQPLELWALARWMGLGSFFASMGVVGFELGRDGWRSVLWAGALSVLCIPSAVWAGAGLATPLVGLLVVAGAALWRRDKFGSAGCFFGWACAWRPELVPFVATWLGCRLGSFAPAQPPRGAWQGVVQFVLVAAVPWAVRGFVFGRLVPLAAVAKAPEPQTALFYAAVTLLWSGVGLLVLVRDRAFRSPGFWAVPWCAHLLAVFFAGGDWMPALRLTAPLMPLLVWDVANRLEPGRLFWAALVPAFGFPLALLWTQGSDFRAVAARRLQVIEQGRPVLADSEVIAATDVGWVGVASPATIVDLGGVTDPRIAPLPGGHTSKQIAPGLFSARDVDTWVIRALDRSYEVGAPLEVIVPAYWVDARLLARNADIGFVGVATLALPGTEGQYVIARRLQAKERFASR